MTKTLDQFLPFILPYAPADDLAAFQAIRHTAIDFCRRTGIVQTVTQKNVTATVEDVTLTVPTDMVLTRVLNMWWQGRELTPVSPDQVDSDVALVGVTIGTAVPQAGSPYYFFQKTPTAATISVYPIPDTTLANGFTIKASFHPTEAAASLDDSLYDDWGEVISAGAVMRLMMTPSQIYSAPKDAVQYRGVYERGVNQAKRQVNNGKLRSNLRVRPQAFAI